MFCPICGKEIILNGASFCPMCGFDLRSSAGYTEKNIVEGSVVKTVSDDTNHYTYDEPVKTVEEPVDLKEIIKAPIYIGNSSTTQNSIDKWSREHNAPSFIASFTPSMNKTSKKKYVALLVALLLVATGCLVVLFVPDLNTGSSTYSTSHSSSNYSAENSITLYDTNGNEITNMELTGAFADGTLTAAMNSSGQLVITLDSSIASNYTNFYWTLVDNDTNSSIGSITKTVPVLYWNSPSAGEFTVTVICYNSNSDSATYSGDMDSYDVTQTYTGTYNGHSYEITVTFDYSEYETYANMNTSGRVVTTYSDVTNFVVISDTVSDIATMLEEQYVNMYGSSASLTDANFAKFILYFVQVEFTYTLDSVQYGEEEYFAYPIETIFSGTGDCEDTSILCAALFSACGYDAAVCILPGHAIAGVALSSYTVSSYDSNNYEEITETINGKTYYGCETTVDSFQDIGIINLKSVQVTNTGGAHPYSYYLTGQWASTYGFFTV